MAASFPGNGAFFPETVGEFTRPFRIDGWPSLRSRTAILRQPVDKLTRTRIGPFRPGSHMSDSTILSIVSMNPPSTNLDENDSILASREFIHRLLKRDGGR